MDPSRVPSPGPEDPGTRTVAATAAADTVNPDRNFQTSLMIQLL